MENKSENLITIMTFSYAHELAIIRGRLESDGIECFVKDELTAQVNPFYSNAIGGIKLQVRESDLEMALAILKESGYFKEEEVPASRIYKKFEDYTSKIPLINKMILEFRLIIVAALIIAFVSFVIYFASLPSIYERLVSRSWCLNEVEYMGKRFSPNSINYIEFTGVNFCDESINFRENSDVILPGFNSAEVWGNWEMADDSLRILNVDSFGYVYNGTYKIEFTDVGLILKSNKTTLYCGREGERNPFL